MTQFETIRQLIESRPRGYSLAQALYRSPEAYAFDVEAILSRTWLMAGMACELPKAGSYLAMAVGSAQVILVRDRDGEVRGFHNSCRHRGSMLCDPGSGHAPRLVCPYHRWTYNLDGSLLAAARMPDDFNKAEFGLRPIQVKTVAGAIFLCVSEDAPDFTEFGAQFERYAKAMRFDQLKLAATDLMVERANWKLAVENGRECYHCPTGHPELAKSFPIDVAGNYRLGEKAHEREMLARLEAAGLPHEAIEGPWWQLARIALNEGVTSISMDGEPVCRKQIIETPHGTIGSLRWSLEPHLFAHAVADHVFTFSCLPAGPEETHVTSKWYVHKDAVEGVDYDPVSMKELWVKTNLQDRTLTENNHRGVMSTGYTPGPYSPDAESLVIRSIDWYCDRARDYFARRPILRTTL